MATTTCYQTTWTYWNSSTTSTCSNEAIWYSWTDTPISTSGSSDTWTIWNSSADVVYIYDQPWNNWNAEDERKRQERRERRIESPRRFEGGLTQNEKHELREKKAKELLLDLIGDDELRVYEQTGRLFVKGKKYDYIVKKEGFVERVEKDKITDLCVHLESRRSFPDTDNVIAIKLAIENEEDKILKLANNHGSRSKPIELPRAACM